LETLKRLTYAAAPPKALVSAPSLKEPHIVFSDFPSGRPVVVGTECGFWGQRRFVFLTRHEMGQNEENFFLALAISASLPALIGERGKEKV
jgi:hypothetical protein